MLSRFEKIRRAPVLLLSASFLAFLWIAEAANDQLVQSNQTARIYRYSHTLCEQLEDDDSV